MKNETPKRWQNYTLYLILFALAAVLVLTVLSWRYYVRRVGQSGDLQPEREYTYHYVMITEDPSSPVWQGIYRSAKARAEEGDACLELLSGWDAGEYSLTDYMNIAVASKADGIIVKPDGTARLREAIDAAEAEGIPVVTVLEDESASSRTSFVGVNSYQMGTTYGKQILRCLQPDAEKVTVLLNHEDAGKDLVFKQLKKTVLEGLRSDRKVAIDSMTISPGGSTFDAEEMIRDLFHDETTRPDLLVCMNETDSECAYYAMVDYNQVGSVRLIGYYQSESMLSAVQKGIVPAVITLDTDQIGKACVDALEEYGEMGHVSSYFSVDLNIITEQNVSRFLPETESR